MFQILVRCDQWLLRYSTFILRSLHYWNILQMNDTELVKRVFTIQKIPPCKNDWILQIREDLKVCGITHTESEIKSMKEYSFKKIVNEKKKELSVKHLLSMKTRNNEEKSKCKNIWPSGDMKAYLKSNELSTEDKRLLFSMRCRVNEVKCNYRTKYKNNITCSLCDSNSEESEVHLLQCESIISEPDVKDSIPQMEYSYIFAEVKKQIKAVKTWRKFFKIRNWKNKIEHCPVMDARRTS